MKKAGIVVAVSVLLLLAVGFGVDRVVASVIGRSVSDQIAAELGDAGSVSTEVHGVPLLTQAMRGSLDHITVTMVDVPATPQLRLETVEVQAYGVSTSTPRTAESVEATATLSTQSLQTLLGDPWAIQTEGDALVISVASGLPVEARVTPTVRDGAVTLDLTSVSVFGVEVSGSSIPQAVRDRVTSLAGSIGELPFGLVPQSITVTPTGIELVASGVDVDLDAPR